MISPRFVALSVILTLSTSSLPFVAAANDWTKPCFNGICEYDIPKATGSSGTVKIWGPTDSIADITKAGGWEILGCDPNALDQEIRLVCTASDNDSKAACGKLFATDSNPGTDIGGAVGKIVRLPESCGKGPFAMITRAWTPVDQSTPKRRSFSSRAENGTAIAGSSAASSAATPSASGAPVRALKLESNFVAAASKTKAKRANTDPVLFAVKAANVAGAEGIDDSALQTRSVQQRYSRRMVEERGLFDIVKDGLDAIKNLNTFNVDKNKALTPVNLDKSFNLVDKQVSCPPFTANLKIDVDAKANAVASVGVVASGTIIPPKVKDFGLIANLNADIDGTLSLLAAVTGTADSGDIKLFEAGIPGLDIPGIFTLGPSFEVNARVSAALDLSLNANVGLNYKVQNAQLVFPPSSSRASQGTFSVGDTPLKLSASGKASATGSIEAHLIPTLNVGISALGGIVDATIFMNLDASAKMTLQADASASGSITAGGKTKRDVELLDEFEGMDAQESAAAEVEDSFTDDTVDAEDDSEDETDPDHADDTVDVRSIRRPIRRPSRPRKPIRRPSRPHKPIRKPIRRPTFPHKPVLIHKPNDSACPAPVTQVVTVTVGEPTQTTVKGGGVVTSVSAAPVKTTTSAGGVKTTSAAPVVPPYGAPVPTKGPGHIDIELPVSSAAPAGTTKGSGATLSSAAPVATTKSAVASVSSAAPATTKGASATVSSAAPPATTTAPGGIVKEGNVAFGGCFTIDAGLTINAGANADFFGLFDKNTKSQLFKKDFELLKKCFGNKAKRAETEGINDFGALFGRSRVGARHLAISARANSRAVSRSLNNLERRIFNLSCSAADSGAAAAPLTPLADEVVPGASAKAI